jgi:hypothetical protein
MPKNVFNVKRTWRLHGWAAESSNARNVPIHFTVQHHSDATEKNLMQFVSDYMKAIDFIALAALVVIAAASLYRGGTIWLLVAAIVVAIWGASRLFGLF